MRYPLKEWVLRAWPLAGPGRSGPKVPRPLSRQWNSPRRGSPGLSFVILVFGLLCSPGYAATLKLSTWNIEWLTHRTTGLPADVVSREPGDFTRLRDYAAILDADVVAFEEVDGPQIAAELFPAGRYTLHLTSDPVVQRVGLAVRSTIAFTANPDYTPLNVYGPAAPQPLRSGADITLHLDHGRMLRVLAVHLKTGCQRDQLDSTRRPACATLAAQVPRLAAWMAARQSENMPFVVMGDFNRVMDGDDALFQALAEAAPLVRATEGWADPCWGGGTFIDHILLGGDAGGWMAANSLRVLVYRETGAGWKERLSDHCPVSVRLTLPD